jgi:hypothetical protein
MEKVDTPPDGPGDTGWEKDPNEGAEVAGRGKNLLLYVCPNDGAGNYVDPSWTWFRCWRCGSNYTGM